MALEGTERHKVRERLVVAAAARQHGVVTADGPLRRLHRGVFLLGALSGQWTAEMAAVLACGHGAVISHHAAASLWRIRPAWRGPIDVTVAGQVRPRSGIRLHRSETLDPPDTRRREGVPVTPPARTLLDLAAVTDHCDLARAIEQAQVLRLVTPRALMAQAPRLLNACLDVHITI